MSESELDKLYDQAIAGSTSPEEAEAIRTVRSGNDTITLPKLLTEEKEEAASVEERSDISTRIREMTIPERIKLAMFGNQTARALLIRDTSKQVPLFVLGNARLTDKEILEFARNKEVSDAVFRGISSNSTWMKNYQVKLALVKNPKVSIDISLRWMKYVYHTDLRQLARSKNISQVVATQARKLVERKH